MWSYGINFTPLFPTSICKAHEGICSQPKFKPELNLLWIYEYDENMMSPAKIYALPEHTKNLGKDRDTTNHSQCRCHSL